MQVLSPQRTEKTSGFPDANSLAFWERMADLVPGILYIFNHETMSNEYSNRPISDLLGYSSDEVLQMGDNFLQKVIHPDDHIALFDYFTSLQELSEGDEAHFEYRVIARDGRALWLRSIDSVFEKAADGSVLRHIGIAVDITAQKQSEARLTQINQELEARVRARTRELEALNDALEERVAERTAQLRDVNRDLKDLTYVATHDLKVPINNMSSLTHMLSEAESSLPPEHAETLGWMRNVCHQASEKLDALICVAQAHSGAFAEFQQVDLTRVTERALVNLHFQISKARAVIKTDFAADAVWFVPRETENILQSMIGNAIKYHAPGRRPRICIRSRTRPGGVEISISDNGTGLDLPRDADKVFGLFKRAHSTPEGAGVSLYAIRRVLERAGGSIDVTGQQGSGCCFSIRLPNRQGAS